MHSLTITQTTIDSVCVLYSTKVVCSLESFSTQEELFLLWEMMSLLPPSPARASIACWYGTVVVASQYPVRARHQKSPKMCDENLIYFSASLYLMKVEVC